LVAIWGDVMKKFLIIILVLLLVCGCSKSDVISEEEINGNNIITSTSESNNNDSNTNSESISDNDLVTYMVEVEDEVDSLLDSSDINATNQNKLRNTFITLTDFIFYDGEIKGKKFSDLTLECKTKIIEIYISIDSKIEEKFPNYKDNIKTSSSNTYNNLANKTTELKNKLLEEYKNYVGEDNYNNLIDSYYEDKSNLESTINEYSPYIEEAKEKSKSVYESVKEKISNWYKEYKESGD
jgi:hypothetical protein